MKKILMVIGGIVVGIVVLGVVIFGVTSLTSKKLVCKSNEGNITKIADKEQDSRTKRRTKAKNDAKAQEAAGGDE